MIPEIETVRLRLRAPRRSDFDTVVAFLESPRAQFLGGDFGTRSRMWRCFAATVGTWLLDGWGYWAVERRADAALVGAVGFSGAPDYPEMELGWDLYEGYESRGYAFEAAGAARDWAFGVRGLPTLVSYIDPANARSIRLAERLGARLDPAAVRPDPLDLVYRHFAPEAAR